MALIARCVKGHFDTRNQNAWLISGSGTLSGKMKVTLCRKSVARLAAEAEPFIEALREREHEPALSDCLQRCQGCDLGLIIATADGMPLSAKTTEKLLRTIDELAED
jgi:hypothetical protein